MSNINPADHVADYDPQNEAKFRETVSADEKQTAAENLREIDLMVEQLSDPVDNGTAAELILEALHKEDMPAEVKTSLFRRMIGLITTPQVRAATPGVTEPGYQAYKQQPRELMYTRNEVIAQSNLDVANIVIDAIRAESDPRLRVRYGAMLARDFDPNFFLKDQETGELIDQPAIIQRIATREAFQALAKDDNPDLARQNWAKIVLEPSETLKSYAHLYDKMSPDDPQLKVLVEEVSDEITTRNNPAGEIIDVRPTGQDVMLRPGYIFNPDKRELYHRLTGKDLPVYVILNEGKPFTKLQFPQDLSRTLNDAAQSYREQQITEDQFYLLFWASIRDYRGRLVPEDQVLLERVLAHGNLDIRFSTERSEVIRASEPAPTPPASNVEPAPTA